MLGERPIVLGAILALVVVVPSAIGSDGSGPVLAAATLAALLTAVLWPRPSERAVDRRDERDPATDPHGIAWLPDPVLLVDRRGIVVAASAGAIRALPGIRLRHPLSFGLRDPRILDAVALVGRTGEPTLATFGGRVATETTYDVRILPLPERPAGPGRPGDVALLLRDVGEDKRVETMRVDFVANVSHELRTPLASLLGFVETLEGPARGDAAARERFLPIMRAQANRMKRLIDDLLQLSRVEMKQHLAPTEPLDLVALASHVLDIMAPAAASAAARLDASLPDGPVLVAGDRDELLRVLENLVQNALRYGSPSGGGRVAISLRPPGGDAPSWVALAVSDDGPGIAPEHIPRLTERFYRVDPSGSRERGGTGLGLAIVKHSVARHRGRLEIRSHPGEGSTFTVLLPPFAGP